mmetsp:Transcript_108911/g.318723  ORF Transcript_108911/g.318723 Transcript_108911/m.318723 type:complete len:548 (-) Transcript_108911:35-1678(-)
MWLPGMHDKVCDFCATLVILTVRTFLGFAQVPRESDDPTRLFWFEPILEGHRLFDHPDAEVRELAEMVKLSAQRHRVCWNRLHLASLSWNSTFGLWFMGAYAHEYLLACRADGGEMFSVRPSGNDTAIFSTHCCMCLPPECDVGFIREYWLPRLFVGRMEHMPDRKLSIPSVRKALGSARILVERVVEFPRPDLPCARLVIAGFALSGTTSMATELRRHPQIAIPRHESSVYWSFIFTPRFVRQQVEPYRLAEAKKRAALPANSSLPILLGLKDPFLAYSINGLQAASRVKDLKVIVMLRDPISLIQTWINRGAEWINPLGDPMGYYVGLQYRATLQILKVIPEERLLLVPTIALSRAPMLAYKRVMQFLGLPEKTKRPFTIRENQFQRPCLFGGCFDFCRAPGGLLAAAHALYRLEARGVEALLRRQGWPEGLVGLLPALPARCPNWVTPREAPAHEAEADPGICYAMHFGPSKCFESMADCLACCESHDNCPLDSRRHNTCCVPLESALLKRARMLTRRALCGSSRSTQWPCNKGFGRFMTMKAP